MSQQLTFLCIETATKLCSVAIVQDGKVLAEKNEKSDQYIHAESLHPFIKAVFDQANLEPKNIDAIVVSKGPGSYTGLRIGVSAAKGLAYALDKPVIAINSLHGIAHAAAQNSTNIDLVVGVIDARRDEVYISNYDVGKNVFSATEALVIDSSFVKLFGDKNVLIVGDASAKVEALIPSSKNILFDTSVTHTSSCLYPLAKERFEANNFEDLAYFEPYYLKEFVAGKPKSQFKKA